MAPETAASHQSRLTPPIPTNTKIHLESDRGNAKQEAPCQATVSRLGSVVGALILSGTKSTAGLCFAASAIEVAALGLVLAASRRRSH
jgi:hypothetical protein